MSDGGQNEYDDTHRNQKGASIGSKLETKTDYLRVVSRIPRWTIDSNSLIAREAIKWLMWVDSAWRITPPSMMSDPEKIVIRRPRPSVAKGAIGIAYKRVRVLAKG